MTLQITEHSELDVLSSAGGEDLLLETRGTRQLKLGMRVSMQLKQHQKEGIKFLWDVLTNTERQASDPPAPAVTAPAVTSSSAALAMQKSLPTKTALLLSSAAAAKGSDSPILQT